MHTAVKRVVVRILGDRVYVESPERPGVSTDEK